MSVAVDTGAVPGFVLELTGAYAKAGAAPGINAWTDWRDLSGGGNDGVLTNQAGTTASGWAGSGTTADPYRLVFDGVDDYVALPLLGELPTKLLTHEAWIKTTSVGDEVVLGETHNSGAPASDLYVLAGGRVGFNIWNDAGTQISVSATENYHDGAWHHLVGTCDGSLMHCYWDGVEIGTPAAPPSGVITVADITLGQFAALNGYCFAGSIAVARIYPFALSAAQVAQNYAAGIPTIQVAGSGSGLLNGLGAGTPAVVLQAVNGAGSALLWGTGAGTPIVVLQAVSGAGAGLLEALAAEIVMGHYAVGSSEDIAGFNGKTRVFTTQAPYDSDLTKLSVYLEDTAGSPPSHARAVVFGNGLTPCLAVSAEAQIPTSPGWVDFVFAMPLHLTAGTWYNAGLIFDDNAASAAWHYDYVASGGDSPVTSSSHDIDTIAVGDAW